LINIGIIIQARLSSTRLPGKILLNFSNNKCILEIIYDRILSYFKLPVIVSTTTNNNDIELVNFCKKKNMNYFCGSEHDVLLRFIDTANSFNLTHIIRICSDNPFINNEYIKQLIDALHNDINLDYISYRIKDKPSILTHFGFFAELVNLKSLNICNESNEKYYHEHVTNYIYTHNNYFKIKWLTAGEIFENNNIRLTVDDNIDFSIIKTLYDEFGENYNPERLFEYINNKPDIKQLMIQQIEKNTK